MHCYTLAYHYHHHILTPPPTATTSAARRTHNCYFYPFSGSKTATKYPTRNGAGQLRIAAAAASGGGGGGFAVAASEESRVSLYEVLGVAEGGTVVEVKKAYKELARKYHPDVSPPGRVAEYTRRFILVQQAYETLSDPALRALYDRDRFAFFSPRRFHHYDIDQVMEQRNEWKTCWQSQLSELKRRSKCKENGLGGNMSWAARMRKQRDESAN